MTHSEPGNFPNRATHVLMYVALFLCIVFLCQRMLARYKQWLEKVFDKKVWIMGRSTLGQHVDTLTECLRKADDLFWSLLWSMCQLFITVVCVITYLDFELFDPFNLMLVYAFESVFGAILLALIRHYSGAKNKFDKYNKSMVKRQKKIIANSDGETLPEYHYLKHTFPAGKGAGTALNSHIQDYLPPTRPIVLLEESVTHKSLSLLLEDVYKYYTSWTKSIDEFLSLFYTQ